MALPEQKEELIRREEVIVSKLLAERFVNLFEQRKAFTLYKIDFNVESDSKHPDGTKYTTTKPVVIEETSGFDDVSNRYLLQDIHGIIGYFIEFETIDYSDGGCDYFIGITQVPNLKSYEDLGKWKNKVLSCRVRPVRHRRERDFLPGIAIQSLVGDRIVVEFFEIEKDIDLEDFCEILTGQPVS